MSGQERPAAEDSGLAEFRDAAVPMDLGHLRQALLRRHWPIRRFGGRLVLAAG
jgi:hypothetical protein